MKTQLIAIVVAVTMVFAMAPLAGETAFAEDENTDVTEVETAEPEAAPEEALEVKDAPEKTVEEYSVWLDGEQLTSDNHSGKGWTYSEYKGNGTLTLTGANLITDDENAMVYAEGINLLVSLNGKNKISNTSKDGYGIRVESDNAQRGHVTILGSGSIELNTNQSAVRARGIYIKNATVKAQNENGYALYATGDGTTEDCKVIIDNSKVDAITGMNYAIHATNDISIADSIVTAEGRGGTGMFTTSNVYVLSSKLTVKAVGTGINVAGSNGKILVSNEGDIEKYVPRLDVTSGQYATALMFGGTLEYDGYELLEPKGGYLQEYYGSWMIFDSNDVAATHVIIGKEETPEPDPKPDPKPAKVNNTMKVTGNTVTVKYKKLKKKSQTVKTAKAYKFTDKGQGTKTYVKVKGKKFKVSKSGRITVKKGLKKGKYKVTVRIKAAGDKTHKQATKTVTVTIKVK